MQNKTKIKAIIFDCFGVLVQGTLDRFQEKYFSHADDQTVEHFRDLSHASDKGVISYEDFVEAAADLAQISVAEANRAFRDTPINTELFAYIRETLKPKYKIGLLSNIGSGRLAEALPEEQLEVFDAKTLSFEAHFAKPEPEIYRLAAQKFDLDPRECLFVDDSNVNILGAQKVGMAGIVYQNFAKFREELSEKLK